MMHVLQPGTPVPWPYGTEAAVFDMRRDSGASLTVGLLLQPGDERAFRKGNLTIGVTEVDDVLAFAFRFDGLATLEAFFSTCVLAPEDRPDPAALFDGINPEQARMTVAAHLVDARVCVFQCVRMFTLSRAQTTFVLGHMQRTRDSTMTRQNYERVCAEMTLRYPSTDDLLAACKLKHVHRR